MVRSRRHASQDMFRLVTLDGHLEAGQIEFRARDEEELVVFEIELGTEQGLVHRPSI